MKKSTKIAYNFDRGECRHSNRVSLSLVSRVPITSTRLTIIMENPEDEYRASKPDYEGWFEEDFENEVSGVSQYYNPDDYISGAVRVENGTVPYDILEFQYP